MGDELKEGNVKFSKGNSETVYTFESTAYSIAVIAASPHGNTYS